MDAKEMYELREREKTMLKIEIYLPLLRLINFMHCKTPSIPDV
jgi:hypothetical protein